MSLFKKPARKFRQRVIRFESEDEEEDEETELNESREKAFKGEIKGKSKANIISDSKNRNLSNTQSVAVKSGGTKEKDGKTDVQPTKTATKLLSFHDEVDEGEVFKLKKSNYSRRLARQLEKERKKRQESASVEIVPSEDSKSEVKKENEGVSKSKSEKGEGTIIAGKDAEDMDVDSDNESEGALPENPFKDVLQSGVIPDAATIYAMKKHRQMAREMGDFIPVEDGDKDDEAKSRLIRDDDNDRSDEDDDEPSRLSFTVNTGAVERQKVREAFLSLQQDTEADLEKEEAAELERWEREQIRKGVSVAQVVQPQPQQYPENQFYSFDSTVIEDRPFYPDVPNKENCVLPIKTVIPESNDSNLTTGAVKARLEERLSSLKELHKAHERELENCRKELVDSHELIEKLEKEAPTSEKNYSLYQQMRGYVKDLVECLDLKVAHIEILDANLIELYKSRSQRLIARRQQDIRDQSDEYSLLSSRILKGSTSETARINRDEQRLRRAAEREGRRMRRRKLRENSLLPSKHYEGMSSDDEEPDIDVMKFKEKKENILEEANTVFEDVVDDFGTILGVKSNFEKWRNEHVTSYIEAFVPLCLPKIFGPFIKLELMRWNPLEDTTNLENLYWFRVLLYYGNSGTVDNEAEDPDLNLLPGIMEKIVLPKITEFVQSVWDPLSSKETANLVTLIKNLSVNYPTIHGKSKQVQKLLQAVSIRILKTLDDDVFVPLYPKELLENRSVDASVFFQRQFWSSVKLLINILKWNGIIAEAPLQDMALASLLNRYLLMGLHTSMTMRDTLDKCKTIVSSLPKSWFSDLKGNKTIPQLQQFSSFLVRYAQTFPLHGSKKSAVEEDTVDTVKEIIQLLITIGSFDDAVILAKKFSIAGFKKS